MVSNFHHSDPKAFRMLVREGLWKSPTPSQCPGFLQANLVILPLRHAFDFFGFCFRNPKPCPVVEVLEPGSTEACLSAPGSDIRTDCPKYRVFERGRVYEAEDIKTLWRQDLVTFLLGCSFTFDFLLQKNWVPVRHIEEDKNVPMYVTKIQCEGFGIFKGPLVVSMRPIPARLIPLVVELSGRYPIAHGAPLHVGDPSELGIQDLGRPDFGDQVTIRPGELPVFWACGVTPQMAIGESGIDFAITHAPGHMFVTDLSLDEVEGGLPLRKPKRR